MMNWEMCPSGHNFKDVTQCQMLVHKKLKWMLLHADVKDTGQRIIRNYKHMTECIKEYMIELCSHTQIVSCYASLDLLCENSSTDRSTYRLIHLPKSIFAGFSFLLKKLRFLHAIHLLKFMTDSKSFHAKKKKKQNETNKSGTGRKVVVVVVREKRKRK